MRFLGLVLGLVYPIWVATDLPHIHRVTLQDLLWKYKYSLHGDEGEALGISWGKTGPAYFMLLWQLWVQASLGVGASIFVFLAQVQDEALGGIRTHSEKTQGISSLQSMLLGFQLASYLWGGFPFSWVSVLMLTGFASTAAAHGDDYSSILNWEGHFKRIIKGCAAGALWYVVIPMILKGRFS